MVIDCPVCGLGQSVRPDILLALATESQFLRWSIRACSGSGSIRWRTDSSYLAPRNLRIGWIFGSFFTFLWAKEGFARKSWQEISYPTNIPQKKNPEPTFFPTFTLLPRTLLKSLLSRGLHPFFPSNFCLLPVLFITKVRFFSLIHKIHNHDWRNLRGCHWYRFGYVTIQLQIGGLTLGREDIGVPNGLGLRDC